MLITYDFPLPPKGCPSREPGGFFTIPHYVTDASLASRRRKLCFDLDTANTQRQETDGDDVHNLSTKTITDNANAVSNGYRVCNQLGAHLLLQLRCTDRAR